MRINIRKSAVWAFQLYVQPSSDPLFSDVLSLYQQHAHLPILIDGAILLGISLTLRLFSKTSPGVILA